MKTMSKLLAVSLSVAALYAPAVFAEKCAEVKGNFIAAKTTLGCTNVTGSATINQARFTGLLRVKGNLTANESSFETLDVTGKVTLNKTSVSKATRIVGPLKANNSSFDGMLEMTTNAVTLNRVTTHDMQIKNSKAGKTLTIAMNESTVVGDITFVGGEGVVKGQKSTVTGKVVNGKLEE